MNYQQLPPQLLAALQQRAQFAGNAGGPRMRPQGVGGPQMMPPQGVGDQQQNPQMMPPQGGGMPMMPPQGGGMPMMPPQGVGAPQGGPQGAQQPNVANMVAGRQQAQNSLFTPENGQFGARMPQAQPGGMSPQGGGTPPNPMAGGQGPNQPQNANQPQGAPGGAGRAFAAGGYAAGGSLYDTIRDRAAASRQLTSRLGPGAPPQVRSAGSLPSISASAQQQIAQAQQVAQQQAAQQQIAQAQQFAAMQNQQAQLAAQNSMAAQPGLQPILQPVATAQASQALDISQIPALNQAYSQYDQNSPELAALIAQINAQNYQAQLAAQNSMSSVQQQIAARGRPTNPSYGGEGTPIGGWTYSSAPAQATPASTTTTPTTSAQPSGSNMMSTPTTSAQPSGSNMMNSTTTSAQPSGSNMMNSTAPTGFAAGGYADGGVPGQNPFVQALQQAQMQASMPTMGGQGQAPAGMDQAQFQSLLNGAQQGAMSDEQRANLLNAMVQKRGQPTASGGLPSLFGGGQ